MGKCCVRFKSPGDLPLEPIGKLISEISSEQWIEMYEQSRLMTKAGQTQKAKQETPDASKVAIRRVSTSVGGKRDEVFQVPELLEAFSCILEAPPGSLLRYLG